MAVPCLVMRAVISAAVLAGCAAVSYAVTINGTLDLTDAPPAATPVEAFMIRLHPAARGRDVGVNPDRKGNFTLTDVAPGIWSLILSFPGRINFFTAGSKTVDPTRVQIGPDTSEPWKISVTLRSVSVTALVSGIPDGHSGVVVLLCPDDPSLTLRESCFVNRLNGAETTFRYAPPGRYRVFVVDGMHQSDVAACAPRSEEFLSGKAAIVDAMADVQASASYIAGTDVNDAVARYHNSFKPN